MSKSNINFSIIIPSYFSSGYIAKILLTIPERDDLEVIVVDDSFDSREHAALKKVVEAKVKRALVVVNTNGKGVCGARNTGLSRASGLWIIFADSDDLFYKKDLSGKMDEYLNTNYDQILFRYDSRLSENREPAGRHKYADFVFKRYSKTNPLSVLLNTGTVYMRFIKRSIIVNNKIQFRDGYRVAEDAIFVTEVTSKSETYTLDKTILYTVLDRDDSVTSRMDYVLFKNWVDAQSLRNALVEKIPDNFSKKDMTQTRLVIIIKALNRLGFKDAVHLNNYAKSVNLPLVRLDELIFLVRRKFMRRK